MAENGQIVLFSYQEIPLKDRAVYKPSPAWLSYNFRFLTYLLPFWFDLFISMYSDHKPKSGWFSGVHGVFFSLFTTNLFASMVCITSHLSSFFVINTITLRAPSFPVTILWQQRLSIFYVYVSFSPGRCKSCRLLRLCVLV